MQRLNLSKALTANIGADAAKRKPTDYTDPADGLIHCGTCHEAKEQVYRPPLEWMREKMGDEVKFSRPCECRRKLDATLSESYAEEAHVLRVAELRKAGIRDERLRACVFEADDGQDAKTGSICRRYAERWEKAKAERIGLLLWGETGCGKTFFAACIANALIEKEARVVITSIPDLSARMMANYGEAREEVLDEARRAPLLILDDVGFERTTPTGLENAFAIINARYDSGKPLIVTSNLTPDEFRNPSDVAHKRTLSRIAEMCAVTLHVQGSRREGIGEDRRARALEALLSDE